MITPGYNEAREARQANIEDDDVENEAEFLTRTRLVLLAGRSLKMADLIVVERSPRISSDCDYSWN